MARKLSILIPYRSDRGGYRDRAFNWIIQRIERTVRGAEVVIGGSEQRIGEPARFWHSRAVNEAAAQAKGEVFLIEDADTFFDPEWLGMAVGLVGNGQASWVLPSVYQQLTEETTKRVFLFPPTVKLQPGEGDLTWSGTTSWAGLVVVPRRGFERVGGYDERFTEWGADDVAIAMALNTLWGPCRRLRGAATHLWHPRSGLDAQPAPQHDLMQRYIEAAGNEDRMREVRGLVAA